MADLDVTQQIPMEKFENSTLDLIDQCIGLKNNDDPKEAIKAEAVYEGFVKIFDSFQEQPHLIDAHLKRLLPRLLEPIYGQVKGTSSNISYHLACKLIYIVSKVRGYKTIIKYLPHEASDLELALSLLAKESTDNISNWQTRYVLWMWLSILFTLPFNFHRFDSSESSQAPLMERVMQLIRKYLVVGDSPRLAAAVACSRFLTRPEISNIYLEQFIDWFLVIDEVYLEKDLAKLNSRIGILLSIAYIFKNGKREDISPYSKPILKKCVYRDISTSNDSLVKILMKIAQHVGLSLLPAKMVSWRYMRGVRSISENLKEYSTNNPGSSKLRKSISEEDEADDNFMVPSEIEDVISFLLDGLRYKCSKVRWSAAKGLGRITSRLPKIIAGEVVSSINDILSLEENESAWHGGCLAMAELARRGLILPDQLAQVIPRVIRASIYEESKGNFSVGAYVRDSACYVLWAFARAYQAEDLRPYIDDVTSSLLVVAVFDREITCRRAASAAYQEMVGRLGNIPHGIEILTTVDNKAVGLIRRAFVELSKFVAQFNDHLHPFISHLLERKINHGDCEIRELSGEALANLIELTPVETISNLILPQLLAMCKSSDLYTKHGGITALASVILALKKSKKSFQFPPDFMDQIKKILEEAEGWLEFRGLKGELLRSAGCSLIQKISLSSLPMNFADALIVSLIKFLNDCSTLSNPKMREIAIPASKAFLECYLDHNKTLSDQWIEHLFQNLIAHQENVRCGALEALCDLPQFLLQSSIISRALLTVITTLDNSNDEDNLWVDWKVAAIRCLTSIITKFDSHSVIANAHSIRSTFHHNLTKAIEDYTTSNKGDIGELVRIAAINSLKELCLYLINEPAAHDIITDETVQRALSQILIHCVSHHYRIKTIACESFFDILYRCQDPFTLANELTSVLPTLEEAKLIHWRDDYTFATWVEIFQVKEFRYPLWKGLLMSIGGIPSKIVDQSSAATREKLKKVKLSDKILFDSILEEFFRVYNDCIGIERLCLPSMNTALMLLRSGLLNDINHEKMECLLDVTWKLVRVTPNPKKKMASIHLFCDSLRFKGLRKKNLSILTTFLCTKYPTLRSFTAENFYIALMCYENIVFENDEHGKRQEEALQILRSCEWNQDIPTISPIRDKLRLILGIKTN
ncbi:tubulin folding cofactor D isoform X2 [Brevipalpus obovatus]|uniref:tubulin folding cofactor D isoform X2 n=1 Tax=Brevipalpus obovatus TaxID=246614 RepID=UPI003D9E3C24